VSETYPFHEVANIFPLSEGADFDAFCADVKEQGLREPIWLHDGKIIDGRNRYRACLAVGVEPRFRTWEGNGSLVAFVVSMNLQRLHYSDSQRAMVAARIAELPRGGDMSKVPIGTSLQEAADLMNVSRRNVARAKSVTSRGVPDLQSAVTEGKVAVSAAAEVATLPPIRQQEVVARGEREIIEKAKEIRAAKKVARRAERFEKLADMSKANPVLGSAFGRYPVIYCDPPWRYDTGSTDPDRDIENQYPTMTLDDICALPVDDIATDDCVLFMWATSPKLGEAFEVLKAWGFTYRTCMVWVKDKVGMGHFVRQQHELVLIARKGAPPTPAESSRPPSVINAPRGRHSEKPALFYELIEKMYPGLPYVELFARKERDGWAAWGNEVGAA
jgi:N6-adenosine-specific RNA methylase IME4